MKHIIILSPEDVMDAVSEFIKKHKDMNVKSIKFDIGNLADPINLVLEGATVEVEE